MRRRKPPADDELLEWTVTERPLAEAEPAAPQRARHPRHDARRTAGLLGGAVLALLVSVWLLALGQEADQRQAVTALIAQEEAAAAAGDAAALRALTLGGDLGWQAAMVQRAHARQAAPAPIPLAHPPLGAGAVLTLTQTAGGLLRADVARDFIIAGRPARFSLPQFYQPAPDTGAWRRVPPPPEVWGETRYRIGPHLLWKFPAADQPLVDALAPALEDTLLAACALWACAAPPSFTIELTTTYGLDDQFLSTEPVFGSRLLALAITPGPVTPAPGRLTVASPRTKGWPEDAAARQAYQEMLAHMLLMQAAADVFDLPVPTQSNTQRLLLRLALTARTAAELGLEPAEVRQVLNPNPAVGLEALWFPGLSNRADLREQLRSALVIVNRVLARRAAPSLGVLMNTLRTAPGPNEWLSLSLGLTPDQAAAELWALGNAPWPIADMATQPQAVTLGCADGLWFWTPGAAAATPVLTGYYPESRPVAWAPGGARLLAHIGGQLAVVDYERLTVFWLPDGHGAEMGQWVDSRTVAYRPVGASRVVFYRPGAEVQPAELPLVNGTYTLAPNGGRAAITQPLAGPTLLALIPTLGGTAQAIGPGAAPAWSPDSRQLVYAVPSVSGARLPELWIAGAAEAGAGRVLVGAAALSNTLTSNPAEARPEAITLQWAPDGQWIAFYLRFVNAVQVHEARLGLIRPDGSGLTWLRDAGLAADPGRFSADGRYFAYPGPEAGLLVYDLQTQTPAALWATPAARAAAWAPAGYGLLAWAPAGLSYWADARPPQAPAAQPVPVPGCETALWRAS